MSWPTIEEFSAYLASSGLIATTPTALQGFLDLQGALDAGIEQWNERTHYWPFLSTGVTTEQRIFQPTGSDLIDLNGGLLTFTSLYTGKVYESTNTLSTGNAQLQYQNFLLKPTDAPQKVKPWTYLQIGFGFREVGLIGITAEWGFCTNANLPESARRAVMALGAIELLPQIEQQLRPGGLIQLQRGDEMKRFGTLGEMVKAWQSQVDDTIKRGGYVRLRMA